MNTNSIRNSTTKCLFKNFYDTCTVYNDKFGLSDTILSFCFSNTHIWIVCENVFDDIPNQFFGTVQKRQKSTDTLRINPWWEHKTFIWPLYNYNNVYRRGSVFRHFFDYPFCYYQWLTRTVYFLKQNNIDFTFQTII